jgi:RNA polymerase-binding transcription factor DksA
VPDEERTRLLTTMETELADVELALARLDAGTYEQCEVCEGEIDDATRATHAAARRCRSCSASD